MTTETPTKMKAAWFTRRGDPFSEEIIKIQEVDMPTLKKGNILVKMHASAMNPVDWKMIDGSFPVLPSKGLVGVDGAGVIDNIPEGIETDLKVGDKVFMAFGEFTPGSFAEYAALDHGKVTKIPSNIDLYQAASLPVAALTALQALSTTCQMKKGSKVFISGGSGGVGSLAVQIAKALGASEIWSSGSRVSYILSLGATKVINYKEENVLDALKGQQFDVMLDTVGQVEPWLAAKQGGLKKDGKYATLAGDGDGSLFKLVGCLIGRSLLHLLRLGPHYTFFSINTNPPSVSHDMKKIKEMVENGQLKPQLMDHEYTFTTDSLQEMFRMSMSGHSQGKLVMKIV